MTAPHNLSLAGLARPAHVQPEAVAVQWEANRVGYGDLESRSKRLAHGLLAAGVKANQRVVFIGRNSVECLEVLLGASKIGAVPTLLNWRLHAGEIAALLKDAAPAFVFTDDEFAGSVTTAVDDLAERPQVLCIGPAQGGSAYPGWRDQFSGDLQEWTADPGATAAQLYTSGTTGGPKGAMLTHRGFATALPDAVDFWGIGPGSVVLSVLPMYHIAGLGLAVGTLWAGGRLLISNDAKPAATLSDIETYGVTHLVLASTMLQALVSAPGFSRADLSSLKTVSYGAAPISAAELKKVIASMDCRIVQPYGLTETTGVLTLLDDADHRQAASDPKLTHRLASCGRARPDVELRIVDPSTAIDVLPGDTGEVWVRSPRVMSGYSNLPEATAEVLLADGWFRTGDLGSLDADGYVTLKARLKDTIISGGENVYPQEVEAVLRSHPDVADVAVVGIPHSKWGETPLAVVVPVTAAALDEEDVRQFVRGRLAHYKCPGAIVTVDELPRNATGKVLLKVLRETFKDHKPFPK